MEKNQALGMAVLFGGAHVNAVCENKRIRAALRDTKDDAVATFLTKCHSFRKLFKLVRNVNRESLVPDLSPFGGSHNKHTVEKPGGCKFLSPQPKQFNLAWYISVQGLSRASPHQLSDSDVYPSTFNFTPERRKFSKDSREKFTRESTQKVVKKLISVGIFPELKHAQFTWFGNLPTPRSYWLY
ncbi:hypothetical protein NC651_031134 [Populus alba x Populus x berolinensis]|nr:hypothetical protein NC651_031134 [Populus alba x Populus x berolinensis]